MEQRAFKRRVVAVEAVISCPRFGMIRGEITDIGKGGLYLCAETSIVPIGSAVSVTFRPDCLLCDGHLTVSGQVTHQSLHGFGIAFDDLEPYCREVLARYLPEMPLAPGHAPPVLRAM